MIDVHAHFAEEGYEIPAEWEKIQSVGVHTVILAADTLKHARMHLEIARSLQGCYFTVGVHPEFAAEPFDEAEFLSLASEEKCVSVGEIGLDFHYGTDQKAAQRACFLRQIALADALGLPLEIHSRDACSETLELLRASKQLLRHGFLMHCYSYGAEVLEDFLALGGYVSFGGVVCFKNARKALESALRCPIDRILTETDSPYLSPFRGEKNTPANIPHIAARLAALKGLSVEEFTSAVRENAMRLFPKLQQK